MKKVRKPRAYTVRVAGELTCIQDIEVLTDKGEEAAQAIALSRVDNGKWQLVLSNKVDVAGIKCDGNPLKVV